MCQVLFQNTDLTYLISEKERDPGAKRQKVLN